MRRPDSFDRSSLVGSLAVHAVALVVALGSTMMGREPVEFISYQIELVSPPPAAQAPEPAPAREELAVERPDPTPPAPEEEKPVVEEEKPKPKPPEPKPTPRQEPPKEAAEERAPAVTDAPVPKEKPKESGEGINVRLEGVRRDYPAYYNNIITQIQRCFRWTGGGSWETTVYFAIRPDGTVSDLDFVKRSGSASFDFDAMGAVECAGKGRFGPLPEELPFDVLPVQFNFRPQGGIRGTFPDGTQTTRGEATERR